MTEQLAYTNKDGTKYTYDGNHLRIYGVDNNLFAKINKADTSNLKMFLNKIEDI